MAMLAMKIKKTKLAITKMTIVMIMIAAMTMVYK